MAVAAGQSNVAVSPFVSYVPSASSNPLAGFSLTFGGTTGLALRGGAEISISNPDRTTTTGHYRPWGADADAMLFLGGLGGGATVFSRTLSPYLFTGIGLTGGDSAGRNTVNNGWSFGAGANLPLGLDADLFAEARWRMSQYVLPTAHNAPDSKSEMRFGLSFHVGGGGSREPPRRSRPGRRYYEDDEREEVVVAQPAPVIVQQPAPVIVQQPAPVIVQQPAPVIIQAPEPEPSTTINVNLPGSNVHRHPRRSGRRVVYSSPSRVVYSTPPRVVTTQSRARATAQPTRVCTSSGTVQARRRGDAKSTECRVVTPRKR